MILDVFLEFFVISVSQSLISRWLISLSDNIFIMVELSTLSFLFGINNWFLRLCDFELEHSRILNGLLIDNFF